MGKKKATSNSRARLVREEIDWETLFQEGFQLTVLGTPASTFVTPCDDEEAVFVILLKAPTDKIEGIKRTLLTLSGAAQNMMTLGRLMGGKS